MSDKKYTNGFEPVEAPKVSPMLIVRVVVFLVAIVNAFAAMLGFDLGLEVNQELTYQIISGVFLMGSGLWTAWKDNDITKKARIEKSKNKK